MSLIKSKEKSAKLQPVSREEVLKWMMGKGEDGYSVTDGWDEHGNTRHRSVTCGRVIKFDRFAERYGERAAKSVLLQLKDEKLVEYKGGGRHSGWWLTEEGWKAAGVAKENPTQVAKAEEKPKLTSADDLKRIMAASRTVQQMHPNATTVVIRNEGEGEPRYQVRSKTGADSKLISDRRHFSVVLAWEKAADRVSAILKRRAESA